MLPFICLAWALVLLPPATRALPSFSYTLPLPSPFDVATNSSIQSHPLSDVDRIYISKCSLLSSRNPEDCLCYYSREGDCLHSRSLRKCATAYEFAKISSRSPVADVTESLPDASFCRSRGPTNPKASPLWNMAASEIFNQMTNASTSLVSTEATVAPHLLSTEGIIRASMVGKNLDSTRWAAALIPLAKEEICMLTYTYEKDSASSLVITLALQELDRRLDGTNTTVSFKLLWYAFNIRSSPFRSSSRHNISSSSSQCNN